MSKLTKKQKQAIEKIDKGTNYKLIDAAKLVKETNYASFDASVDIDVKLGIDPRKTDQMVRGTVSLPHGTGKEMRVLALCKPEKEEEAKQAGADYAGLDEFIDKIKQGWTDIDVIITTPDCMSKVGPIGKVLGPRGLMPNPKSGTVTQDLAQTIKEVKLGKIDFKVDKTGIIHSPVGRVSFSPEKIAENARELIHIIKTLKPSSSKGTYIQSIHLSSSMSPGIKVDSKSLEE
jgi:large subunit ribosomal protein L1